MKLSKAERTTLIRWNELDRGADIITHSAKWKNRLNELCQLEPDNYILVQKEDENGRAVYRIRKDRLPLPRQKRG